MPRLPDSVTAKQLGEHLAISEHRLRVDARRTGFCRIVGKAMFFTQEAVDYLLLYWQPSQDDQKVDHDDEACESGSYDAAEEMP